MNDRSSSRITSKARGFTLIELLVVIAIIALLSGLVFPILGRSLNSGRTTASVSNLRQIHLIFTTNLLDNNGEYPTARGLDLPEEMHWRRVIWEHSYGEFKGSPPDVMAAMQASDYSKVMWCPVMVKKHGQKQHPFGRGSYGINRYFMDPSWGGGYRAEGESTLVGVKEPYIMGGTVLVKNPNSPNDTDPAFGTDAHIDSSKFPYNTDWANLAYEYGADGDMAIGLYIDGHVEKIPKQAGIDLHDQLSDPRTLD